MKLKEVFNRNYRKRLENIRLESRKKAKSGVNFKPGTLGFLHTEKGQRETNSSSVMEQANKELARTSTEGAQSVEKN